MTLDREKHRRLMAVMAELAATVGRLLAALAAAVRQWLKAVAPVVEQLRAAQARRPIWAPRLEARR